MKKLYRYTMGNTDLFAPAEDAQDAYERRSEVDHTFEWTPVEITQVEVEGYTIVCVSDEELAAEEAAIEDELPTDDEGQAELPMTEKPKRGAKK